MMHSTNTRATWTINLLLLGLIGVVAAAPANKDTVTTVTGKALDRVLEKIPGSLVSPAAPIQTPLDKDGNRLPEISTRARTGTIYHAGWVDFNKNGKKDVYEDPTAPREKRIDDLLSQMNLDEKTCQLCTLYGYQRVLRDEVPTAKWKTEVWKDGIGNIDEQFNGFTGWFKPKQTTQFAWPASRHAWGINMIQQWFVENTRLGIPVDFTNEGIRGLEAMRATNFPTQLGMGHTWNVKLVRRAGEIEGREAKLLGYTNVYAPILDVGRDQRWGRYEEVYGESPFLVAELGVALASGIQSQGVASTAKHYCIYSASKGAREGFSRTDPQIGLRETEMIHMMPFKEVIRRADLKGVMSSYNDYDGVPISGSSYYMIDKLRTEYGFSGYVVSDSDAVRYMHNKHHTVATYKEAVGEFIKAGGNVRTTFNHPKNFILPLRELVKEGKVPMATIDARVRDVLGVKFWMGLFDAPYATDYAKADAEVNSPANNAVALQASRESMVLLKNEGNLLPLNAGRLKRVLVTGPNATETEFATMHYGPQDVKVVTTLEGLQTKLKGRAEVVYSKGCEMINAGWPDTELIPTPLDKTERAMIDAAVRAAKTVDVIVAVVGGGNRTCGENKSRTSLNLPGRQLQLLQALYKTGKPLVVVMISGRPLSINWTKKYAPAILAAWYPGSHGGTAIADVLFGDYNPGGRLTVTFPKTAGQIPMHFPAKPASQVDAGGKRARVNGVLWPFGYGQSYTTFAYSGLKISPAIAKVDTPVTVSCTVKNVGKRAGDEVVQLYLQDRVSSVTTYEKQLRGFERVALKPGESKRVTFTILPKHMQLLNREMKWVVEPGEFRIFVGGDSTRSKLDGKFVQADAAILAAQKAAGAKRDKLKKFVNASNCVKGEPAVNVIDGDEDTRWASGVKGVHLDVELPSAKTISQIEILWYKPNITRKYKFEIQVSSGGGQWTTVARRTTYSPKDKYEIYRFKATPASAIRIVGLGNNEHAYTAIKELRIPGVKFE